ncbi:MAG: hypothetical protein V4509_01735 [Patescibacteria group bacterium]
MSEIKFKEIENIVDKLKDELYESMYQEIQNILDDLDNFTYYMDEQDQDNLEKSINKLDTFSPDYYKGRLSAIKDISDKITHEIKKFK